MTIELVPASDNLDLSKREADLAIRFARPVCGGLRTKAQKLGELAFGAYVSGNIPAEQHEMLGWITYDDAHSSLPQARWLESAATRSTETHSNLKVADADTALEAVASGIGKSLLPEVIAKADPRLCSLSLDGVPRLPVREVWLLAHVDQTSRLSIIAVKDWLTGLFSSWVRTP